MGNIISYVRWRGAFSFSESPFCIIDNLALALISYIDFKDIVSSESERISICEASEQLSKNGIVSAGACKDLPELFILMAKSKRFGDIGLSNYMSVFDDETATQFAAVCVTLPDDSIYVSYRGTDESIAGWQEDFSIGSQIVPSQRMALDYLNGLELNGVNLRIGGHSKGGNLAMYAAMNCKQWIRDSLITVYNNDGPGFCSDIVSEESYKTIEKRLEWIVPGFSVIGTLFPYKGATMIVQSSNSGIMQHDAMSWQIEGDGFCTRNEPEKESQLFVQTFDKWIASVNMEQRESFAKEFFNALRTSGAKSFSDLRCDGIDGYFTILLSIAQSESRTKIVIAKLVASFIDNCRSIKLSEALKKRQTIVGGLLIIVGLVLMRLPQIALQFMGSAVGVAAVLYGARRVFQCAMNIDMDASQKKKRLATWLIIVCASELVTVNQSISVLSTRLILCMLLSVFAFRTIYLLPKRNNRSVAQKVIAVSLSLYAATLAIVTLTSVGAESTVIFIIGALAIAIGILRVLYSVYEIGKKNCREKSAF